MKNNILTQTLFDADILCEGFQILLEGRLDFIKSKYNGTIDPVVDHLAEHSDPTKNKKFTEWLVQRHLKGDDVLSPEVKEGLRHFQKASPKAHDTNIKNHTVSSMLDVAHMVKTSPKVQGEGNLEELYSEDGVRGYKIPDKQTSIKTYGQGQKHPSTWCTAANSSTNAFESTEGGKYTMHFPNGAYMQFNHQSWQTKDPKNTEIDFHRDSRYAPYKDHIRKFMLHTAKLEGDGVDHTERKLGISDDRFDQMWHSYKQDIDSDEILDHIKSHKLSDEQFDTLKRRGHANKLSMNPFLTHDQVGSLVKSNITNHLVSNPALKGEHLDSVFDTLIDPKNSHSHFRIERLHNLQPKHVDKVLELQRTHPVADSKEALHALIEKQQPFSEEQLKHPSLTTHDRFEIGRYQSIGEHRVSVMKSLTSVLDHRQLPASTENFLDKNPPSDEEQKKLVDSIKFYQRAASGNKLLRTKSIHQHHIDDLVATHSVTSPAVMRSDRVSNEMAEKHLKSVDYPDLDTIDAYTNRRGAKASVVDESNHALDPDHLTHTNYYGLKDLPKSRLSDPDHAPHVIQNLHHHPDYTADDLHKGIDALHEWTEKNASHPSGGMIRSIMNHPSVNPTHMHRLLNSWGHDWIVRTNIEMHPRTPPSVLKHMIVTSY